MNQLEIPDIKAKITVTGKDFLWSGCRPAHSGGLYLTTGLHTYIGVDNICLLYTSPSPRDAHESRMPSSA